MFLIYHAFAYFTYDSIIEVYYGTSDLLTNMHHVIVVGATFVHVTTKFGGFEYAFTHFLAEISNPSLVLRTIYKIFGIREGWIFHFNEYFFALSFLSIRLIATPIWMYFIYESYNLIYLHKICISLIMAIQMFWCYRILQITCRTLIKKDDDNYGLSGYMLRKLDIAMKFVLGKTFLARCFHFLMFLIFVVFP
jgi:hypothetical protein